MTRTMKWLFFFLLILAPAAASATAVGCTYHANTAPRIDDFGNPRCMSSPGGSCYYCEYHVTGVGGYTVCSENSDSSVSWCVDYRDLPPFQVALPAPAVEMLASFFPIGGGTAPAAPPFLF
jgi:hypothetical protein